MATEKIEHDRTEPEPKLDKERRVSAELIEKVGELNAEAATLAERPDHLYVSTYCQHRRHNDCRLTCKLCAAHCLCPCHANDDPNNAWMGRAETKQES